MKYLVKAVKIVLLTVLVVAIAVFAYVTLNKKQIIEQVTTEIGSKLNGKVDIKNIELSFFRNFPHISLLLQQVVITDTAFNTHHHNFFTGNEVFVSINVVKMIRHKPPITGVRVQGGELYLYTDTSGYTNTYLLNPKKGKTDSSQTTEAKNELTNILLKDLRLVVDDRKKGKLHDLVLNQLKLDIKNEDARVLLFAKTDIKVNSLAFNTARGSYLENKSFRGNFGLLYQRAAKQLSFDSINIQLSRQPFNLSGRFDFAGPNPQFMLRIHTRKATYSYIKSALPARLDSALSIVDLDQPIDASAIMSGPLKGGEPRVDVDWSADNTRLTTLFMDFDKASFKGRYTNEVLHGLPRKDANSKITISGFKASWHGLPVTSGTIEIRDLSAPLLICDLNSDFPVTKLNEVAGTRALNFKQGTGKVRLTYSGPLVRNNNTNSFLNGVIAFKDAAIEYTPRNVEMKKVNGQLIFKNAGVFVENLQCVIANNPMIMQGQASNLVTLVNSQPNQVNINWTIHAPLLNLGSFLYLLKSPSEPGHRHNGKKTGLKTMASKIDELIEHGRVHIQLNANKLIYKKFEASNAVADVTLLEDRYLINKVSMNHSGGRIDLKGSLLNKQHLHQAELQVDMDNVNVNKVFTDFDNFGQNGITAQSLEGKLWANINASMNLDDEGKVIPASIISTIDFSLRDGALNNYEPVKKIQQFIFKKRNFDNIRFAELTNRLEVRNQEIKVNRMEIQSSVLSMYVEGVYSQKGKTDLSIQVPLSNLKKRRDGYTPENKGLTKKAGSSIFLRGQPGEDGNIKFKLDLFNKYDKEKKATVL